MIRVLQIIDSLQVGGAERVAVNYANGLTDFIDESHLCVTREEGPLLKSVDSNVDYIYLNKKSTLDIKAIFKLKEYVSKNRIDILHAHSSSFFIAILVKMLLPSLKIVWHDHYGNSELLNQRPKTILRLSSRFFSHIFSVNSQLKDWSINNLVCEKVSYMKNFAVLNKLFSDLTFLAGREDKRILCLANLRQQKNHIRLLEAFEIIKNKYPDWSLHCVGKDFKDAYSELFFSKIKTLNLKEDVYFYDSRSDILNIMKQCNIGLLISKSEGLPLALLEYGIAKLPVISTDVGNCGMLISDESLGVLLSTDNKQEVADAIICYIENEKYMKSSASNFNTKIKNEYSGDVILKDILGIYESIISLKRPN